MALCATVAAVAVTVFLRTHDDEVTSVTGPTQTEPADNGTASPEPGEGEGEGEPEGEADPELETREALLAAANLGAHIRVLNDTGPSGEAARGTAALQAAGFGAAEAANYPGDSGLAASSVWYTGDYRDTALAVAYLLGIPEDRVTEHSIPQGNVNVIIRSALPLH